LAAVTLFLLSAFGGSSGGFMADTIAPTFLYAAPRTGAGDIGVSPSLTATISGALIAPVAFSRWHISHAGSALLQFDQFAVEFPGRDRLVQ
jgi:hypothetical protein